MSHKNSKRNITGTQKAGIRDGNSAKGKIRTARSKKIVPPTKVRKPFKNPQDKRNHPKVKGGQRDIDRYLMRNPT